MERFKACVRKDSMVEDETRVSNVGDTAKALSIDLPH